MHGNQDMKNDGQDARNIRPVLYGHSLLTWHASIFRPSTWTRHEARRDTCHGKSNTSAHPSSPAVTSILGSICKQRTDMRGANI